MLGQQVRSVVQGLADVRLESLARAPAILPINQFAEDTAIASGVGKVTVVRFRMRRGHVGYLSGLGHETTNVGWNNISWSLEVKRIEQRGWQSQVGRQWGRVNQPGAGEVYIVLTEGALVEMRAEHTAGVSIPASGLLIGAFWSRVSPVESRKT